MNDVKREFRNERSGKEHSDIPVVEETVQVGKKVIETGGVRIIKRVDEETVEVPLTARKTSYSIERVPLNQYLDNAPPAIRHEGNTMIMSIVEEEVFVQKRLKLVEEVRITLNETEANTPAEVILKRERLIIERDQANNK